MLQQKRELKQRAQQKQIETQQLLPLKSNELEIFDELNDAKEQFYRHLPGVSCAKFQFLTGVPQNNDLSINFIRAKIRH